MSPEDALVPVRFVHYWSVLGLVGIAAFPLYAGAAGRVIAPRMTGPAALMSLAAIASGVLWLLVETAHFGGDWSAAGNGDVLSAVLFETGFGRLWMWRLLLAATLLPVATMAAGPARDGLVLGVATLLAGSLAMTGHAAMASGPEGLFHRSADATHLLAAGVWIGGLVPLARLLHAPVQQALLDQALQRFSTIGVIAVGLILVTGIANATLIAGSPIPALATGWGRTLAVKLLLVALMIAAAAINRLVLMPAGRHRAIGRLVAFEQSLALAVLAAVSLLGTLAPDGMM